MADTIIEQAVQQLVTNLKTLAPTVLSTVNRDVRVGPSVASTPHVNVFEITDRNTEFGPDTPISKRTRVLQLLLEIWVSDKFDGPKRVNNIEGEIIKVLKATAAAQFQLGGKVIDTRVGDARNFISEDQQFIGKEIDVELLYRVQLADPFTL